MSPSSALPSQTLSIVCSIFCIVALAASFDAKAQFTWVDSSCDSVIDRVNSAGDEYNKLVQAAIASLENGSPTTELGKATLLSYFGTEVGDVIQRRYKTLQKAFANQPILLELYCDGSAFEWVTTFQEGAQKGEPVGNDGKWHAKEGRSNPAKDPLYLDGKKTVERTDICQTPEGKPASGVSVVEGKHIIVCPDSFKDLEVMPTSEQTLGTSLDKLTSTGSTLLHEVTHCILGTIDSAYQVNGVILTAKFGKKTGIALKNADTWAYYAMACLANQNAWVLGIAQATDNFGPKAPPTKGKRSYIPGQKGKRKVLAENSPTTFMTIPRAQILKARSPGPETVTVTVTMTSPRTCGAGSSSIGLSSGSSGVSIANGTSSGGSTSGSTASTGSSAAGGSATKTNAAGEASISASETAGSSNNNAGTGSSLGTTTTGKASASASKISGTSPFTGNSGASTDTGTQGRTSTNAGASGPTTTAGNPGSAPITNQSPSPTVIMETDGTSTYPETFLPTTYRQFSNLKTTTTVDTIAPGGGKSTVHVIIGPGGLGWQLPNIPKGGPVPKLPTLPPSPGVGGGGGNGDPNKSQPQNSNKQSTDNTSTASSTKSSESPSSCASTQTVSDCSVICPASTSSASPASQSCSTTCYSTITGCSASGSITTVTASGSSSGSSGYYIFETEAIHEEVSNTVSLSEIAGVVASGFAANSIDGGASNGSFASTATASPGFRSSAVSASTSTASPGPSPTPQPTQTIASSQPSSTTNAPTTTSPATSAPFALSYHFPCTSS
ncbi:MAG: hypothetical protein Q9225_004784 [Loekoesia sp. 1 TL-2023]